MAENIVGKGENAGYQHFLLFPQCFQKSYFSRSLKVGVVWERVEMAKLFTEVVKDTCFIPDRVFLFYPLVRLFLALLFMKNTEGLS